MKEHQLHLFNHTVEEKSLKRRCVTIPLDTLILAGIVASLLLTVAFSIGIERGRKITHLDLNQEKVTAAAIKTLDPEQKTAELKPLPVQISEKEQKKAKPAIIAEDESDKYIIQVATYVTESRAQREADNLKSKGFPVYIAKKDQFIVIFVGEFDDENNAKKNLTNLKQRYKDCFIKIVKR